MIENNIIYRGFRNEIYRKMNHYWLKVSPWKNGEERRVSDSYFHTGDKYYTIPKKYAPRILNRMFDNFEDTWWYKGYFFKTKANDTILNTTPKEHVFNGCFIYYLIYRQGELYWAEPTETKKYRLYEFKGEDKMPLQCIGYYSGKGLKPIYKLSKEWEVI